MRDLLAAAASAFLADAALPLLLWTLAAFAIEAALRAGRAHAALGLPVRSALLAALPLSLAMGPLVRRATPDAVVVSEPLARVREAVLPEIVVGAPAAAPLGPPDALVWLGAALALAVLVGVVALVRLAKAHARLHRLNWPDAPADVRDRARALLGSAGRRARVVTGGTVPFTYGAWRPVVAVPPDLTGAALDLALAHEAAHVRAHDYAAQVAARAVAAVFAAHPLVHALVRGMALDRERLADAAVLAARPDARRAYADLLVSLSAVRAPRLALAVARPPLLHRLTAMTTPTSPTRLRAARRAGYLLGSLMLTAVALGGFVTAQKASGERTFQMLHPTTIVNGVTVEQGVIEIRADGFRFLELALLGYGRFIISDAPFDGATRAGRFDGPRLDVTVGGETVSITAQAPLFSGGETVAAYARFDAFEGTRLPVGEAALIVGVTQSLDRFGTLDPAEHERAYRSAVAAQEARQLAGEPPAEGVIAWRMTAAGDTVYDAVEQMPEMTGGMAAFAERLAYPAGARADGVSGTTILRLVVGPAGRASQIEVARTAGDARLDSAAVQAVRAQPFTPGRQNGRAVAVRLTLPIRFALPASPDQGSRQGVIRYAGIDLSRLENGAQIQAMIDQLPDALAAERAPFGDARVDYTLTADGRHLDLRATGQSALLRDAASEIVRAFVSPERSRPVGTWDGFFQIWYAPG